MMIYSGCLDFLLHLLAIQCTRALSMHSISVFEVHKKTGAEIVSNGIMGRNLGTKQNCRPQIQSHNTIGYEFGTSLFMNFGNAKCFDLLGPF